MGVLGEEEGILGLEVPLKYSREAAKSVHGELRERSRLSHKSVTHHDIGGRRLVAIESTGDHELTWRGEKETDIRYVCGIQ